MGRYHINLFTEFHFEFEITLKKLGFAWLRNTSFLCDKLCEDCILLCVEKDLFRLDDALNRIEFPL